MKPIPELIELIHARGGKMTPQRLAIYQALEDDTTHPTAEEILARVRPSIPMVSLTTVYKTLNELVALGELRRFDVHGTSHFDPRTDAHAEVVCLNCNTVMDVEYAAAPPAPAIDGFHVIGQTQTFFGYCADCRTSG